MLLFSVFIFGIAVNLLYTYFKNSKEIFIDQKRIVVGGKGLLWEEIEEIQLGGKRSFGFFNYQLEAAELKFRNGEKYYIFENVYSNGAALKNFIKKVIVEKSNHLPVLTKVSEREIKDEAFYTYAGSPFFSFRGIMLWGLILFILLAVISNGNKSSAKMLLFLVPVCLFWFVFNAYSMDYFEVSKKFLVVRNHFFFWKKEIFRLGEIEELVFETQPKQANMLRVISSDFKTNLYRAGTLKDSTWLEFKSDLETKNVVVRNECI